MTNEEVFEILAESIRQNKVIQNSPNTFFKSSDVAVGMRNAEQRITALSMAIAALRAQQTTTKLDRSWWEGCQECTPPSCGTCVHYDHRNTGDPCTTSCIRFSKHKPVNFCKNCGRPLTAALKRGEGRQ